MTSDQDKPESQVKPSSPTKVYDSPHLITYGNIREITKTLGAKGQADGSIVPLANKTDLL